MRRLLERVLQIEIGNIRRNITVSVNLNPIPGGPRKSNNFDLHTGECIRYKCRIVKCHSRIHGDEMKSQRSIRSKPVWVLVRFSIQGFMEGREDLISFHSVVGEGGGA